MRLEYVVNEYYDFLIFLIARANLRGAGGVPLLPQVLVDAWSGMGGAAGRTLTGARWCALCAVGYPEAGVTFSPAAVPVEDVPHVVGACPGLVGG